MDENIDLLNFCDDSAIFVRGYSDQELVLISTLYDIEIKGQLRQFMRVCGRCAAYKFGDDPMIIFREYWDVRAQFLFQVEFRSLLGRLGEYRDFEMPFCFSWENENEYAFLKSSVDDEVFVFNENINRIQETNMDFLTYLQDVNSRLGPANVICVGELLTV